MTRNPRPDNCRGCKIPFRPNKVPAELYPDTVVHAGKGLCSTCWSRNKHSNLGPAALVECPCGQLTRPRGMAAEVALKLDPRPTITRIGSVCYRCSDGRPKVTPERTAYVTRELLAYLRWRGRDISQLGLAS